MDKDDVLKDLFAGKPGASRWQAARGLWRDGTRNMTTAQQVGTAAALVAGLILVSPALLVSAVVVHPFCRAVLWAVRPR